jgi:cytochrome c-type biogenesis protein CcmH
MNITFWILMILMLLLAIGLLVYPILKVRQSSTVAYKESNLNINDEKIKELDLDLEEGRIDQLFYKAAREELDRELLIDIPAESRENAGLHYAGAAKKQPALALIITIFIPALVLLIYLQLGMHSASNEEFIASQKRLPQSASKQGSTTQPASMEQLTQQLSARIEKNGGSVQDWTMLARAHKYLGQYELAEKSFVVALQQDENNAQLMLELAEVMALSNNRQFSAESRELVLKAYELQPDNANVLWFSGVAEYQFGNYRQAIDRLTALLPLASSEEDVVKSAKAMIANSRQQLIAAGEEMPELEEMLGVSTLADAGMSKAAPDVTSAVATQTSAAAATSTTATTGSITSLSVIVNVSDEVRQKFNANDVIFVYAKAKQGPRMPLAAQRMTLAELPATVVLDDSMAMVEGMNLSAFEQLVVSARASKSGSAIAQSGDYIGSADFDNNKTQASVNIVIDTAVP